MVIDPNGDFAQQVAMFKENAGRKGRKKLMYIRPDLFDDLFPVLNLFGAECKDEKTLNRVVQEMYKTLVQSFKEMDMKLTGAMEGMLLKMLYVLYSKPDAYILDLIRFVDDDQNQDLVAIGCASNNVVVRDYFQFKFMKPLKE